MTKEEAIVYFPFSEEDEPEDRYEEEIFSYKQFFLSKTPLKKIFSGRLTKMQKMHEAYEILIGSMNCEFEKANNSFPKSNVIADVFANYQEKRNLIRKKIMWSRTVPEVAFWVEELIVVQGKYLSMWPVVDIGEEQIIASLEPDPMLLLKDIQAFESNGYTTFDDLKKFQLENNPYKTLVMEMKRLSLCRKLEGDE